MENFETNNQLTSTDKTKQTRKQNEIKRSYTDRHRFSYRRWIHSCSSYICPKCVRTLRIDGVRTLLTSGISTLFTVVIDLNLSMQASLLDHF